MYIKEISSAIMLFGNELTQIWDYNQKCNKMTIFSIGNAATQHLSQLHSIHSFSMWRSW